MSAYSVAAAKTALPRLIDQALEGEEVIITRHGKPVAELRPLPQTARSATPASYAWLRSRRLQRNGVGVTSVELLDRLYDDPAR